MARIRHSGHWTLEDKFRSSWQYLPVDVPSGTHALRVELEYARNGAVLDLGCLGPGGFRGWSGGARESFVIGADAATPGYLPGELEPGTWLVTLGLHQLPSEGTDYRIEAEVTGTPGRLAPEPGRAQARMESGPPPPAQRPLAQRPPRRDLPATAGRRWLAGDLHAHTEHSDGSMTVPELAAYAASRGLDFLAVTDHNTVSHHADLPAAAAAQQITLLPGQEVTRAEGHANAFGALPWIDFREPPDDWLAATERGGGLLSVNHPYGGQLSWMFGMRRRPPLAEIWHWSWLDPHWTTPLAWWLAWDPGAIPVGGSDWHQGGHDAPPGTPTTWAEVAVEGAASGAAATAAAEPEQVLAALRAGRTAISAGRDGPVLLRTDGELVAVDADGLILTGPDGPQARVRGAVARFPGAAGAHRLTGATGATFALTG